jgi:hypothetical protein
MSNLKQYLKENTFYDSTTKQSFLDDKKSQVGTLFWIHFLGIVSLYTVDPSNSKLVSYLKASPVRLQNVDDTHSDLVLSIKILYDDKKINQALADRITKLLALLKMGNITVDENIIRDIIKKLGYHKAYCHMKLRPYIDDFESGKTALKDLVVPFFRLAKHEKIGTEFTDLAKHIIPKIEDEKSDIELSKRGRKPGSTNKPTVQPSNVVSTNPMTAVVVAPLVVKDFNYFLNNIPTQPDNYIDQLYCMLKVWKMSSSERNAWFSIGSKRIIADFIRSSQYVGIFEKVFNGGSNAIDNTDPRVKELPALDASWFTPQIKHELYDTWLRTAESMMGNYFIWNFLKYNFDMNNPEHLALTFITPAFSKIPSVEITAKIKSKLSSTSPESLIKSFYAISGYSEFSADNTYITKKLIGYLQILVNESSYINWDMVVPTIKQYTSDPQLKLLYAAFSFLGEVRKAFKKVGVLGKTGYTDNLSKEELADIPLDLDDAIIKNFINKINIKSRSIDPILAKELETSSISSILDKYNKKQYFLNSMRGNQFISTTSIPNIFFWGIDIELFKPEDDDLLSEILTHIKTENSTTIQNAIKNIDISKPINTLFPKTNEAFKDLVKTFLGQLTSKFEAYSLKSVVTYVLTPTEILSSMVDVEIIKDACIGTYSELISKEDKIKNQTLIYDILSKKLGEQELLQLLFNIVREYSERVWTTKPEIYNKIIAFGKEQGNMSALKDIYYNFVQKSESIVPKELFVELSNYYVDLVVKEEGGDFFSDLSYKSQLKTLFSPDRYYSNTNITEDAYNSNPRLKEMVDSVIEKTFESFTKVKDFLKSKKEYGTISDPTDVTDRGYITRFPEMSDMEQFRTPIGAIKILSLMEFNNNEEKPQKFRDETYEVLDLLVKKFSPENVEQTYEGMKLDLKDSPEKFSVDQKLTWLNLTYNKGVKIKTNWSGRARKGELQKIRETFAGDVGNIMFDIFYSPKKMELNGILDRLGDKKPIAVKSLKDAVVILPLMTAILGSDSPIRPAKTLTKKEVMGLLKFNNFHVDDTVARIKTKKAETTIDMLERFVSNAADMNNIADDIKLQVTERKVEKEDLEKMTAELGFYMAPPNVDGTDRHGDIAGEVIQVFDADFKGEGFEEFKAKYPDTVLNNVFHGTSEMYASMILRFGFKIANASLEQSAGIKVAGKALGPGVYIAKFCDKSMGYFKEEGRSWTNRKGNYGLLFEMECYTGGPGSPPSGFHRSAGFKGSTDESFSFKSPEWALKTNAQWRIYRVYKIRTTSKKYVTTMQDKHNIKKDTVTTESTMFPKMFMTFKNFIRESDTIDVGLMNNTSKPTKGILSYEFFENSIPVDKENLMFVDDFFDIYGSNTISVQSTQLGWMVEFVVPVDINELCTIPDSDEWALTDPDGSFSKYLYWFNKLKK